MSGAPHPEFMAPLMTLHVLTFRALLSLAQARSQPLGGVAATLS